jgi:hypothetical protein
MAGVYPSEAKVRIRKLDGTNEEPSLVASPSLNDKYYTNEKALVYYY